MLIGTNDIVRYSGDLEIPQLGGDIIKGYGEIAMSKETGVVFIAQFIIFYYKGNHWIFFHIINGFISIHLAFAIK